MALEDVPKEINTKLEDMNAKLATVATREDVQNVRDDMDRLTVRLTKRIDLLECSLFDLNKEKDRLSKDVSCLKAENKELHSKVMQCSKVSSGLQRDLNDQEQHYRQWNLRVYGVKENQGESTEDCVQKCMEVFSNKVGVTVRTDDIEIAHRAGKPGWSRPRPILARFFQQEAEEPSVGRP
ncbi:hypothetical protein ACOMHN_007820 [Nucella lapillus]